MLIRKANMDDLNEIYDLYKAVVGTNLGVLIQQYEYEVNQKYVKSELEKALLYGVAFVLILDGKINGFLKGYTSPFYAMAHILTNLTMLTHPSIMHRGYGNRLMKHGMNYVENDMRHIMSCDTICYADNHSAIRLYRASKFQVISIIDSGLIRFNGKFVDNLFLRWHNKNFSHSALTEYRSYLASLH